MILQKILFPNEKICTEEDLYFRRSDCNFYSNVEKRISSFYETVTDRDEFDSYAIRTVFPCLNTDEISGFFKKNLNNELDEIRQRKESGVPAVVFSKEGQSLSFDTYFNSVSIYKWKKYTNLKNMSVSLDILGSFKVEIKNVVRSNNTDSVQVIDAFEVFEGKRNRVCFDIDIDSANVGLVYLELTLTGEAGVFFGGEYTTDVGEDDNAICSPVKIAVAICTYKREKYIECNIELLNEFLERSEDSILHDNVNFFIADNGNSLDVERLSSKNVQIFPNKNLGGAGGFGRAMYEILKVKDKDKYTHILMMDDDVKLDPHVFERLTAFLSLIRDEYRGAHIGGAMLELDRMWMQSETGEYWFGNRHIPVKFRYDLRDVKWLLKNEKEDSTNYICWWFCCMPISVLREDNMPLPVFIKRDDIEYTMRNTKDFIFVNGISVWHEAFDKKYSPFLDYYYYRNMLILNSRHRKNFNLDRMLSFFYEEIREAIDKDVNLYRYKDAHTKLQGIDDFLKGIDWLMEQDAEELNNAVIKRWSYQFKPIEELNFLFIHGKLEKAIRYRRNEGQTGEREVAVTFNDPNIEAVADAERVLYYDETSQKGYVAERDDFQRDLVYKHFDMTLKKILSDYEKVRTEYDERYDELINISHWEKHLFEDSNKGEIPKQWWEDIVCVPERRRIAAVDKLYQYDLEMNIQKEKMGEYPIVNNKVVIYFYGRKGMSCNVKYILLELLKEAKDKLEIIWVSDYPETCESVTKLGVPVIKGGTKEHWEAHFTAKVNITSDCQPPYFIKRPDQTAITAWHGIAYKTIGFDCLGPSSDEELQIFGLKNKQPDVWLSGSRRFTEETAPSFRLDKGIFQPTGMARNDVFFADDESMSEIVKKVRDSVGIEDGKKIMLYAPTFRRGGRGINTVFDVAMVKEALGQRFGGDWEILYRGHYFVGDDINSEMINVSDYEDMQELLCAADVLVSDYSSCLWDFTFTGRPSFVFASDLEEFLNNDRGFSLPIDKWPYPLSTDTNSLCDVIINFDEDDYSKKVAEHQEYEGSYEEGDSAAKACRIILDACGIE